MTLQEARRHQEHGCDVWDEVTDHIGVITRIHRFEGGRTGARVAGHPQYGPAWVDLDRLGTACKIKG